MSKNGSVSDDVIAVIEQRVRKVISCRANEGQSEGQPQAAPASKSSPPAPLIRQTRQNSASKSNTNKACASPDGRQPPKSSAAADTVRPRQNIEPSTCQQISQERVPTVHNDHGDSAAKEPVSMHVRETSTHAVATAAAVAVAPSRSVHDHVSQREPHSDNDSDRRVNSIQTSSAAPASTTTRGLVPRSVKRAMAQSGARGTKVSRVALPDEIRVLPLTRENLALLPVDTKIRPGPGLYHPSAGKPRAWRQAFGGSHGSPPAVEGSYDSQ